MAKKNFKDYLREAELPKPIDVEGEDGADENQDVEAPSFEEIRDSLKDFQAKVISMRELPLDKEGKIMSEFETLDQLMKDIRNTLESKFFKTKKLNETKTKLEK